MSGPGEITTLKIADLSIRLDFQVRNELDQPTLARYVSVLKAGGRMPPVKVAVIEGVPTLVDGFHRIEAMGQVGLLEVEAEVFTASELDARWMGASANLTHGLPLTNKEVRHVFKVFVQSGKCWKGRPFKSDPISYRQIAEALGNLVAHTTVRHWMRKDFPRIFQRMSGTEEFVGKGGLQETFKPIPFLDDALSGVKVAREAAKNITDPFLRGELIHAMEDALETVRQWAPYEPLDF